MALASESEPVVAGVAGAAPVATLEVASGVHVGFRGYVDVGWFDAGGDGVSYVRRLRDPDRPARAPWVFTGDPWASAVNTQGEPADLGLDRTALPRFDTIGSGGRPTFLVNMVSQSVDVVIEQWVELETTVELSPRSGTLGSPGDALAVETAAITLAPPGWGDLQIAAGKVESAFGIEYRTRQAPRRPGITPSIMSRYTTASPVGVKVRGTALAGGFLWNATVTNGSTTTERFGHSADELDSNGLPTGTLRLAADRRGTLHVQFGLSGQAGAADRQPDPGVGMVQAGADLTLEITHASLRAEVIATDRGRPPGGGDHLEARGGYAEVDLRPTRRWATVFRVDRRAANLRAGPNRYRSDVTRLAAGLRLELSHHVILKGELLKVWELLGPEIPDDVVTTSFVAHY